MNLVYMTCPPIVDFPASTWPIKTTLMYSFFTVATPGGFVFFGAGVAVEVSSAKSSDGEADLSGVSLSSQPANKE